ncbi:transmembrane-type terpene cyclase [Portibacter marinus]|uniref:transmembrane-type terpene cyclase n=1 Tax=Portibacter marinus TaxID=2898660 RepID=UPI001F470199|nr:hypothetical protein [Portibacter marinus]
MWSMPWFNTAEYNTVGLVINIIGCIFWLIAYVILVRNIIVIKFVEMPAYVGGANFGWEFVYAFPYHPTTGLAFALAYIGAFFLDVYIYFNLFRYGHKQPILKEFKKHLKPLLLANFTLWLLACYFFKRQGLDDGIGATSGYVINMIISILCLVMMYRMNDPSKFSLSFAWCRMLGSGLIGVSAAIFYPENYFVMLLSGICILIDCTFISILTKRKNGKALA